MSELPHSQGWQWQAPRLACCLVMLTDILQQTRFQAHLDAVVLNEALVVTRHRQTPGPMSELSYSRSWQWQAPQLACCLVMLTEPLQQQSQTQLARRSHLAAVF